MCIYNNIMIDNIIINIFKVITFNKLSNNDNDTE